MSDFPYFPLYPTDLLGDEKVIVQDLAEFGAYVRLLCLAWQRNPPATIPADDAVIAKMLGVTPDVWSGLRPAVLACWHTRGNLYENKRLKAIHAKMMESHHKRRKAGMLGGKQKSSNARALLKHSGSGNGDGNGVGPPVFPEGESEGKPPPAAEVLRWARHAYTAFPAKPPNVPSGILAANCRELIRLGREWADFERLVGWRRQTKLVHAPNSPTALCDPEKWDQWQEMSRKENNGSQFDRKRGAVVTDADHAKGF